MMRIAFARSAVFAGRKCRCAGLDLQDQAAAARRRSADAASRRSAKPTQRRSATLFRRQETRGRGDGELHQECVSDAVGNWPVGDRACRGRPRYSPAIAISARNSARSASIEMRPSAVSTCQKVQPLQASRPCASAPMRWIEPTVVAERDRAVGAHQRLHGGAWRRRASRPARRRPRSISAANGTRGASRAVMNGASVVAGSGSTAAMRCSAARGIVALALDADEAAAEALRHRAGGAGAAERVEHEVVRPRGRQDDAREQRLRLLRRVQLLAVAVLEPLLAGAERQGPVGAHLDVLVAGLQRFVVEGVALGAGARAPPRSASRARW